MTLSSVALAAGTAATVGALGQHNIQEVALPAAVERQLTHAQGDALHLVEFLESVEADLRGLAAHPMLPALLASAGDAYQEGYASALQQFTNTVARELTPHREYRGFQLVSADARQLLTLVRDTGDTGFGRAGLIPIAYDLYAPARPASGIGEPEFSIADVAEASAGLIRVATVVRAVGHGDAAMAVYVEPPVIQDARSDGRTLLVDTGGHYLGVGAGAGPRLQDDLPALADLVGTGRPEVRTVVDRSGTRLTAAVAPVRVAGAAPLALVRLAEQQELANSADPLLGSVAVGGALSVAVALVLSIGMSLTLTRPLGRIVTFVEGGSWATRDLPTGNRGEIGKLARAVERYVARDRALMENVGDAIITVDADGIVESLNLAGETMFGLPETEAKGKVLHEFFDGADPLTSGAQFLLWLTREGEPRYGRHSDGRKFPVELTVNDAQVEHRLYSIVIVRDITARISAESRLRASERRFNTMFHSSPAASVIIRLSDARTMDANKSWLDLLGLAREDVLGKTTVELRIFDDPRTPVQFEQEMRHSSSVRGRELRMRRKDGRAVTVLASMERTEIDGEPCFIVSCIDLTDYKNKEAQLRQAQKMEALGQLTGGIAHDFNNFLTVVLGNAELIVARAEPAIQELGRAVLEAADRGANLTQQLLTISRRQTLEPEFLDPNTVLRSLQAMLDRVLGEDIALNVDLQSKRRISVDRNQFEASILNLAINARDAMPGGGKLSIATQDYRASDDSPELPPGEYVKVTVRDSGTGMTPEVLARVFEPFFTTKPAGKGTGLGLPMVYGFVKQSGGHVVLKSEPGAGTMVTLYLPEAKADAPAQIEEPLAAADSENSAVRPAEVIAVVEDEPRVRDLTTSQLKSLGYKVLVFKDGPSALAELACNGADCDLLLTDVVLPGGMNGREVADALAARKPGLRVLFASGYSRDAIEDQGILAPGVHLLRKPFRKAELAVKIREALAAPSYQPVGNLTLGRVS